MTMEAEKELFYLYCVADQAPLLKEGRDLFDHPFFVQHEGLYAVVSRVAGAKFDEENLKKNLCDLEWVKLHVITHEQVIEDVMEHAGVVPFKFATLFKSFESLKAMLAERAALLKETLQKLRGLEEWGVKIYCDRERLRASLSHDTEILEMDREIAASAPGKAFILKKKKEALLDLKTAAKLNEHGQASFDLLRGLCARSRINKLLPKEVTEKTEDMILNAAFLIRTDGVRAFAEAVDGLKARHEAGGLSFDRTGPWPPYNFCDFSVERAEAHGRP